MSDREKATKAINIAGWSAAYLRGELDDVEIADLRNAMHSENWFRLVRRKYLADHKAKIIEILNKPENDTKDICRLLVMLLEAPQ